MSAQHTPGPWIVDDVEGCIAIAADSDGEVLAYLAQPHQQTNPRSAEETDANASLIAAAPELLESVRELSQMLSEWHADMPDSVGDNEPAAMARARAAITKATGSASHG